jgi:hypothetical protein
MRRKTKKTQSWTELEMRWKKAFASLDKESKRCEKTAAQLRSQQDALKKEIKRLGKTTLRLRCQRNEEFPGL